MRCAVGPWGGRRPSLGDYVTGTGATRGPPPLEGVHVDYPPATEMLVRQPFISCSGLSCEWPTVANLLGTGRLRDHQPV